VQQVSQVDDQQKVTLNIILQYQRANSASRRSPQLQHLDPKHTNTRITEKVPNCSARLFIVMMWPSVSNDYRFPFLFCVLQNMKESEGRHTTSRNLLNSSSRSAVTKCLPIVWSWCSDATPPRKHRQYGSHHMHCRWRLLLTLRRAYRCVPYGHNRTKQPCVHRASQHP
jgi:hypothetical protein